MFVYIGLRVENTKVEGADVVMDFSQKIEEEREMLDTGQLLMSRGREGVTSPFALPLPKMVSFAAV